MSFTFEIPKSDEIVHEIVGFIRVYKDGHCERLVGTNKLPAGIDSSTGVISKDVVISPETNLSARIYIPKTVTTDRKLPVLIYIHGGGFIVESTTSSDYHPTLNYLTAGSNVITVSVDYRLGPENPVPAGYNDCWEAIHWVASHCTGGGPDPWLNNIGDFQKVFFAGDSAGANIVHSMGVRFRLDPIAGINLKGVLLLDPYFGGVVAIGSEREKGKEMKAFTDQFWNLANPSVTGLDDPLFNPEKDPRMSGVGCSRILLCVAELDSLRDRGLLYKEMMEKNGWPGKLEMLESKGEDHVFFLFDHTSENARILFDTICTFINHSC
ncbi:putative carboxylesterase [Helianthus anomalus]